MAPIYEIHNQKVYSILFAIHNRPLRDVLTTQARDTLLLKKEWQQLRFSRGNSYNAVKSEVSGHLGKLERFARGR
jgi:hypothetical protein